MGEFKGYSNCNGETEKLYKYACLMVSVDISPTLKYLQDNILSEDVYREDGYGFESKPHTTILYGFHDDKMVIEKLKHLTSLYKPFDIVLDSISCFENEDFDVLKFDVNSKTLIELNMQCRDTFEHTCTFTKFNPHVTIAYLNKGTGKKYISSISPLTIHVSNLTYNRIDGTKIKWTL